MITHESNTEINEIKLFNLENDCSNGTTTIPDTEYFNVLSPFEGCYVADGCASSSNNNIKNCSAALNGLKLDSTCDIAYANGNCKRLGDTYCCKVKDCPDDIYFHFDEGSDKMMKYGYSLKKGGNVDTKYYVQPQSYGLDLHYDAEEQSYSINADDVFNLPQQTIRDNPSQVFVYNGSANAQFSGFTVTAALADGSTSSATIKVNPAEGVATGQGEEKLTAMVSNGSSVSQCTLPVHFNVNTVCPVGCTPYLPSDNIYFFMYETKIQPGDYGGELTCYCSRTCNPVTSTQESQLISGRLCTTWTGGNTADNLTCCKHNIDCPDGLYFDISYDSDTARENISNISIDKVELRNANGSLFNGFITDPNTVLFNLEANWAGNSSSLSNKNAHCNFGSSALGSKITCGTIKTSESNTESLETFTAQLRRTAADTWSTVLTNATVRQGAGYISECNIPTKVNATRNTNCDNSQGYYDDKPTDNYFSYFQTTIDGSQCYIRGGCNEANGYYNSEPSADYFTTTTVAAPVSGGTMTCYKSTGCNISRGAYASTPNTNFFTVRAQTKGTTCYRATSCNTSAGAVKDIPSYFKYMSSKASGSTCYRATGCVYGALLPRETITSITCGPKPKMIVYVKHETQYYGVVYSTSVYNHKFTIFDVYGADEYYSRVNEIGIDRSKAHELEISMELIVHGTTNKYVTKTIKGTQAQGSHWNTSGQNILTSSSLEGYMEGVTLKSVKIKQTTDGLSDTVSLMTSDDRGSSATVAMPPEDIKVVFSDCKDPWYFEEQDTSYFNNESNGSCYRAKSCNISGGAYSTAPNTEFFTTSYKSSNSITCYRADDCASNATGTKPTTNTIYFTTSMSKASGKTCYKVGCKSPYSSTPNGSAVSSTSGATCYWGDCSQAGEYNYYWKSTIPPTNNDMVKYTAHDEYQQCKKVVCNDSRGYYSNINNNSSTTLNSIYFSTSSAYHSDTGTTCYYAKYNEYTKDYCATEATSNEPNSDVVYYGTGEVVEPGKTSKIKCYRPLRCKEANGYYNSSSINPTIFTTAMAEDTGILSCYYATGCQEGYTTTGTGTPVAQSGNVKCYEQQCPAGSFYSSSWPSDNVTPQRFEYDEFSASTPYCYVPYCYSSNGYYSSASSLTEYFATGTVTNPYVSSVNCHYATGCNASSYSSKPSTSYYVVTSQTVKSGSKNITCYKQDCDNTKGYYNSVSTTYFTTSKVTDSTTNLNCYYATGCQEGYTTTGTGTPVAQSGNVKCYANVSTICPDGYFYDSSSSLSLCHLKERYSSDSSSPYYNCQKVTGCKSTCCNNTPVAGYAASCNIQGYTACSTQGGIECCGKSSIINPTTCPLGYYAYTGTPSQTGYKYTEHALTSGCWKVECADGYSTSGTGINIAENRLGTGMMCGKESGTLPTFKCPTAVAISLGLSKDTPISTTTYLAITSALFADSDGALSMSTIEDITINGSISMTGNYTITRTVDTLNTSCKNSLCMPTSSTSSLGTLTGQRMKEIGTFGGEYRVGASFDASGCCVPTSVTLNEITYYEGSLSFTKDGKTCIVDKVIPGESPGSGLLTPIQ